jgi:hypothetical protein
MVTIRENPSDASLAPGRIGRDGQMGFLAGWWYAAQQLLGQSCGGLCEQKRKSFVPLSSSRHELLGSWCHFRVLVRDGSLH